MSERRIVMKLLVLAVIAAGLWTLTHTYAASVYDQLDLLVDVRHELMQNYVERPDDQELVESAVRGMVESLDDPYTVFLNAEDLEPFEQQIRGRFSGIGAEVDMHEDRLRIVSPLEDSPAWEAGVMAGDVVLEIEGQSTEGMSLQEAVKLLTGEAGTDVTIRVRHRSGDEEDITITREVINVPTIRGFHRLDDNGYEYMLDSQRGIGYVRISQFTDTTAEDMAQIIESLKQQGLKALIIDVRFNPGGLLQAAKDVSDLLLPVGERIVSIKGRSTPERVFMSDEQPLLGPEVPVVIIANESSASASEILTGALSENSRALFVGTRTFGKGSVQTVKQLLDGRAAIKLTSAYYYLPTGRNIHRTGKDDDAWGVDPSDGAYVPMSVDEVRDLIDARRKDVLESANASKQLGDVTPTWIEETLKDKQLAAALEATVGRLESGTWPKVGKSVTEQVTRERKRRQLLAQKERVEEALHEIEQDLAALDEGRDPTSDKATEKLKKAVEAGRDVMPEAGTIDAEKSDLPEKPKPGTTKPQE